MNADTDPKGHGDGCCLAPAGPCEDDLLSATNYNHYNHAYQSLKPSVAICPPQGGDKDGSSSGERGPLNISTNVLLVYRLHEMRHMENVNFALAIACLSYCGINIALIIVNFVNSRSDDDDDPPVNEKWFHMLEFWSTFVFAIVECISLTSTPKSLMNIYDNPLVLRLVLFFNIVATLLPAVLIFLNYEYFEILSHNVEYLNELTMSFVDLVLFWSLCRFDRGKGGSLVMAGIASLIAVIQLAVYNGMGRTEDGDMKGEVPAHYLEFCFEIISSVIAFFFCLDNKFVCGKEIGEILYGTHRDCGICSANLNEFEGTYLVRRSNSAPGRRYERAATVV